MKSTIVNEQGHACCPVCGADSFVSKRTGKGKLLGGLVAPKRLKCDGCGTNLQRGKAPKKAAGPATTLGDVLRRGRS